jgi:CTP synthase (UTP-ammonia lyase)
MPTTIRIALIGDYSPEITAHVAIPRALALAARDLDCAVEPTWIATVELAQAAAPTLAEYQAIWCVPGSPYASMDGALNAIQFAREAPRPFLGTCGGCQHALIEYARNVLGLDAADHAETNPDAQMPVISALACALRETTGQIRLFDGSRIRAIYGQAEIVEGYNCSYGLNPQYRALLEDGRLHVTAADADGDVRAVELSGHPFFVATLFQPERSALKGVAHPLIGAYLGAAIEQALEAATTLTHA